MNSKVSWSIADILDIEYFLARDQGKGDDEIVRRDRDIYLHNLADAHPCSRLTDSVFLKTWLNSRRKAALRSGKPAILPGGLWQELYRLFSIGSMVFGLMIGSGLAWGFLAYSGRQPINVAIFLGLFVGVQIGLLTLMAIAFFHRFLAGRAASGFPILARLLSSLFLKLARKLHGSALSRLSASNRQAIQAALRIVQAKNHYYSRLMFWPFFCLIQLFGIGYNIGVLAVLLFKVTVTDMAFGWQSSLDLSPAAVHHIVALIASPWSWLIGEGIGYPTVQQIEGSRLILKDGIYHLSTSNLLSWWPFLALSLLAYGLVPRLMLYGLGRIRIKFILDGMNFTSGRFRSIVRRMLTPAIDTQAVPGQGDTVRPLMSTPMESSGKGPAEGNVSPPESREQALLLVPGELKEDFSLEVFKRFASTILAGRVLHVEFFNDDGQALQAVDSYKRISGGLMDVFLIQEGWQPPIRENLAFLTTLRERLGREDEISILLVGRPSRANMFTPAARQDTNIWRTRLAALADPELHVRQLVKS